MLKTIFSLLLILSINTLAKDTPMKTIYDFKVNTIDGKETTLEQYKGKVMLIVNVASKCGYTPQDVFLEAVGVHDVRYLFPDDVDKLAQNLESIQL